MKINFILIKNLYLKILEILYISKHTVGVLLLQLVKTIEFFFVGEYPKET